MNIKSAFVLVKGGAQDINNGIQSKFLEQINHEPMVWIENAVVGVRCNTNGDTSPIHLHDMARYRPRRVMAMCNKHNSALTLKFAQDADHTRIHYRVQIVGMFG
jgi:hypothetical protein